MSTPIFFLDIDGVVNAVGEDLPSHLVAARASTAGTSWPINYSPDVVRVINEIHRSGLAEVRWLTTWGQDARTSFAHAVGLDNFVAYDMYDGVRWWKDEIVADSVETERRPLVWVDDQITDRERASVSALIQVPSLLIAPEPSTGLDAAEVRRVLEFLSSRQVGVAESLSGSNVCGPAPRTRGNPAK